MTYYFHLTGIAFFKRSLPVCQMEWWKGKLGGGIQKPRLEKLVLRVPDIGRKKGFRILHGNITAAVNSQSKP